MLPSNEIVLNADRFVGLIAGYEDWGVDKLRERTDQKVEGCIYNPSLRFTEFQQ
jgi:hypothetical protein